MKKYEGIWRNRWKIRRTLPMYEPWDLEKFRARRLIYGPGEGGGGFAIFRFRSIPEKTWNMSNVKKMKEYVENIDIFDLALPYRLWNLEKSWALLPAHRLWKISFEIDRSAKLERHERRSLFFISAKKFYRLNKFKSSLDSFQVTKLTWGKSLEFLKKCSDKFTKLIN